MAFLRIKYGFISRGRGFKEISGRSEEGKGVIIKSLGNPGKSKLIKNLYPQHGGTFFFLEKPYFVAPLKSFCPASFFVL